MSRMHPAVPRDRQAAEVWNDDGGSSTYRALLQQASVVGTNESCLSGGWAPKNNRFELLCAPARTAGYV